MHENFISLTQEKRDKIINAAMQEFSAKGFEKASTNVIVKNAGISKGALFHYFASKRDLFEFLFRYGINFLIGATKPRIKTLPSDVFERWIAYAALKLEIASQYPDMSKFMQSAYKDDALEATSLLRGEYEHFSTTLQALIYEGIDYSKFRPGADTAKALKIIWWVLEGFALSQLKDAPPPVDIRQWSEHVKKLTLEMTEYLALLKKAFYKEEFWGE